MPRNIKFDDSTLSGIISSAELDSFSDALKNAETMLSNKSGAGSDFLGWLNLPKSIGEKELAAIEAAAQKIRSESDVLICIGIGGSYLGAKAAIEFMLPAFESQRKPLVVFAGHTINSDQLTDLHSLIKDKNVSVNVISKSGTTTEPGIAFRVVRQWMEQKYGKKGSASRIVATTDPSSGALRKLATEEGYATFSIPSDVGGRFSVLTPVGLLPVAVAGINIRSLVSGAAEAQGFCSNGTLGDNPAARYAAVRNILFRRGNLIEVLASFQPQLYFISEWWKQLAGESEGKNNTGIFPASLNFTTDLHSLGQWMQEGTRSVFETFIMFDKTRETVTVPSFGGDNSDGLEFLAGKSFEEANSFAYKGTLLAHMDGKVPCTTLRLADRTETTLGQLFYFFEKAIALSGYVLRVNPFDQPGVEAYKKNMFALMDKPGFEVQGAALRKRLDGLV